MTKTFIDCSIYSGSDWHDSQQTDRMLKENGSYEITNINRTIAADIHETLLSVDCSSYDMNGNLVESNRLANIPDVTAIQSYLDNKTSFTVNCEKPDENGEYNTSAYYNPEKQLLVVSYCYGQYTSESLYIVQHIEEENIRYFAMENILCPTKGVSNISRFYQDPFLTAKEAEDALASVPLHKELSPFGSEAILVVLDINNIKDTPWYKENKEINDLLAAHPELNTPEHYRMYVLTHIEHLNSMINN